MNVRAFDWVAHHACCRPDKLACIDRHSGRSLTYRDFHDRIGRLASFLTRSFGIRKGDRVAVLSYNNTNIFEVQFACQRIGAIFVPLNYRLTAHELGFILRDSSPAVLFADGDLHALVEEILSATNELPHIKWQAGLLDSAYESGIIRNVPSREWTDVSHDDVWTLMYTSGTTGRPKGVLITYGMTFWNCINTGMAWLVSRDATHLCMLPLFHTGGLNVLCNPMFHAGGTVVVVRDVNPAEILSLISNKDLNITHTVGVPVIFQKLLEHPDFAAADFSRMRYVAVGSAPVSAPLLNAYLRKGVSLVQGYGMTETSPGVIGLLAEDSERKLGSIGKPFLHTEVRVVDKSGNDVVKGTVGELWVRGPNVTPGYWNQPEETAKTISDGWLHTGDAVRVDDDGYYYIVDRWKDMYISGGENVYPAEVESVIHQMQEVQECAVVGVSDEKWGEVGCAAIVVKEAAILTKEAVLAFCTRKLSREKQPRYVRFLSELPRNQGGKVLKRELRQFLATTIEKSS